MTVNEPPPWWAPDCVLLRAGLGASVRGVVDRERCGVPCERVGPACEVLDREPP